MTAKGIRECFGQESVAQAMKSCESPLHAELALRGIGCSMLSEIAAQLAELNETLSKVIAIYGSGHVVNVANVPKDTP